MTRILTDDDYAFATDAQVEEELRGVSLYLYHRLTSRASRAGVQFKGAPWPCLERASLSVILRGVSLIKEALSQQSAGSKETPVESPAKAQETQVSQPGVVLDMCSNRPLIERLRIRLFITAKERGLSTGKECREARLEATNRVLAKHGLRPVQSWSDLTVAGYNLLLDEVESGRLVWTDAPHLQAAESEAA